MSQHHRKCLPYVCCGPLRRFLMRLDQEFGFSQISRGKHRLGLRGITARVHNNQMAHPQCESHGGLASPRIRVTAFFFMNLASADFTLIFKGPFMFV